MINSADRQYPWISVAPMLDVTNIHFRHFCRLLSTNVQLWTEMVVSDTIIYCHNDPDREILLREGSLQKSDVDEPIVLQIGGNDPTKVADAIEIAIKYGFRSFNLNIGCPSQRVACKGNFGAYLYKDPDLVAKIVGTVNHRIKSLNTRISVKTRIGVDDCDSYDILHNFISVVSGTTPRIGKSQGVGSEEDFLGATCYIIHSRKAWLDGLDPQKNRTIPSLKYTWVYKLVCDFPHLDFVINGGIDSLDKAEELLWGVWKPTCKDTGESYTPEYNDKYLAIEKLSKRVKVDDNSNTITDYDSEVIERARKLKNGLPLYGVMIGREIMNNPCILANVDRKFYNSEAPKTSLNRKVLIESYIEYLNKLKPRNNNKYHQKNNDINLTNSNIHLDIIDNVPNKFSIGELFNCLKPVFGVLCRLKGAKVWRRILTKKIQDSKLTSENILPGDILSSALLEFETKFPGILNQSIIEN
ncbi:dihydrouridine synthase family protein [Cryptosporidium muris RN66]|uniref:Dihydrouridine synthase family protein n=1 Tax=Cryptosporidium muris (strain RN66) TaxID=441375 RepID=B6AK02_CRYMR|nr:dihydrouridine synthase family protein [Cryptosporidium muris RN66]EEA08543.1 dihydrouridine synthase family protein [Cryptosporidium muris RN66]|eukprot:XP_002142892.1 dihydrouridine synthase family protein [Cryptosporidium muris RN66]